MEPIELDDIQRLLVQGYPARREASYALLEIRDAEAARSWLGSQIDSIGTAVKSSRDEDAKVPDVGELDRRLAIAFTWEGLKKLGFCEAGTKWRISLSNVARPIESRWFRMR